MKILAALCFALASSGALAQHSHGVGQLGIVVENDRLTLLLEIPQHDLVGFERAAKTAREQVTVQATLEKLGQPERLFTPAAAGQCVLAEKSITAPLLTGGQATGGHGDVEARYVYRCVQPAALNELRTSVNKEFPRLRALTVSFAGAKGQKAGRLDAKNPVFAW
ncbi:MAG: hypothetical protein CVU34_06130 [Betaproteobacteria bacterium HGW-Betaproteobacteria-7]|jgi:hypothetical protein|nr:MAG: hypothetical protein CVU34_06130 [Betaproteobacteria bacterium HGW-Betaproteobacteria-7]